MTVDAKTVKYDCRNVYIPPESTTTELLSHPVTSRHTASKHEHQQQAMHLSPTKLWMKPYKSRLCTLSVLTCCVFFCFTFLYTGFNSSGKSSILCPVIVDQPPPSRHPLIGDRLRFPRTRRRLPQCIIIGCKKGGTRALLEYLNIHPKVQIAPLEMHFFNVEHKYEMGLDWYRRHMPFTFPDQITVEKTPAYFITKSVPERIRAMNESIKLLLLVRDPVTRVISDYAQLYSNKVRKGKEMESFEDLALTSDGEVNIEYKAIQISMYEVHLSNWLKYFSLDQIHIVDGGRLIADPVAELRLVEDFLGVDHFISSEYVFFNQTKGFYCLRDRGTERCLSESKGRKHPDVDPKVISKLRAFYEPYNKRFYDLTGRDFGWPKQ